MAMRQQSPPGVPVGLSKFCGRRRELSQLRALLASDRLVTVIGTGGIGKTRLAMELGRVAAFDFPDGVWVVELARIDSADLVATAIAEAIAAPPDSQTDALSRSARQLEPGRQLLILDNCEHVLAGAANAVWALLTTCTRLTVLATSREALNVQGERPWRLLPLSLPESGGPGAGVQANGDAVELFCDRAQLLDPHVDMPIDTATAIEDICRSLDGLPLALELAAAWVPVLSVRQVADRLADGVALLEREQTGRPDRHRSMRATLEWSQRLLTSDQAAAFTRLSVYVGGFSLEGAGAVCGRDGADAESTFDLVAALVDRSLVMAETTGTQARYRMLEPVRQYAAEQLAENPGDAQRARMRQLTFLMELAEAAEQPILGGPDQPWLQRLDAELGNIRSALTWGFGHNHGDAARLTAALLVYCRHRSLLEEGLRWALAAAESTGRLRARALCMAGHLASELGDAPSGSRYLDEAYRLASEGNWQEDLVMVLAAKCLADYVGGDLASMKEHGEEAVATARHLDSDAHVMWALWGPGVAASVRGENQHALELFNEALAIAVRLDNHTWRSVLATNVIDIAVDMGDDATARDGLRSALASFTAEDPATATYLIEDAAILAIRRGDAREGLRLLGGARAASGRNGFRETPDEAERRRHWREVAWKDTNPADAEAAWEEGLALSVGAALDAARGLVARGDGEAVGVQAPDPRAGDAASNSLVREGEFWSLTYANVARRVRESKGMHDLAALVATPGRGVAAVDLVSAPAGGAIVTTARTLAMGVEGDTGETLDTVARAQYRARLVDLEEEISESDAANDPERASRARDEQGFLLAELGAAVGLSGRPRRGLDPAERARKAVTWRIRDAIHRIEAAHPALGQHLRRSVRTGSICMYDPAEPTAWRVTLVR